MKFTDHQQLEKEIARLHELQAEAHRLDALREYLDGGGKAGCLIPALASLDDDEVERRLQSALREAWWKAAGALAVKGMCIQPLKSNTVTVVNTGKVVLGPNLSFSLLGSESLFTSGARPGSLRLNDTPVKEEEDHFNSPEMLAPVGCELVIKLPDGTRLTVFRTKHLAERSGEIEYRLADDSIIHGRFPWTYP